MRLVYGYAVAVAAAMLIPQGIGAQAQEAARAVAGGGITAAGLDRQDRRERGEERADAEQLEAGGGRRRAARDHRPGDDLLEPGQQGERQLYGQGDVQGTEVHEPERSSASVRDRDRRQRPGHAHPELSLLRRLRQRHLHRPRLRPRAVPGERPTRRAQRGDRQGAPGPASRSRRRSPSRSRATKWSARSTARWSAATTSPRWSPPAS